MTRCARSSAGQTEPDLTLRHQSGHPPECPQNRPLRCQCGNVRKPIRYDASVVSTLFFHTRNPSRNHRRRIVRSEHGYSAANYKGSAVNRSKILRRQFGVTACSAVVESAVFSPNWGCNPERDYELSGVEAPSAPSPFLLVTLNRVPPSRVPSESSRRTVGYSGS